MDQTTLIVIIVACVIALFVIAYFVSKARTKKKATECPIDLEALFKALGGVDNIVKAESTPSTLRATLESQNGIDLDAIKALGASGVVQGADSVTMIFGKASAAIEAAMYARLGK